MWTKKTIIVGITGGIASFKSASLASQLKQKGFNVHVVMTKNATKFITPLTLQALSGNHVTVDTFEENIPDVINHIHLADIADLIIVSPATANFIAKMAHGLADNMLSNILLAAKCKVLICPAMNVNMYHNPITQRNITILKELGIHFLDPISGHLACGYEAEGKLPPTETIVETIDSLLEKKGI